MDARYIFPATVNTVLVWRLGRHGELVISFFVQQVSVLELKFVILALTFLLVFLFTYVEVSIHLGPVHLRAENFSIALTALLLASFFLPPSHFWAVYLVTLFSCRWHQTFVQQLRRFFPLFSGALRRIRTYSIVIVVQNEEGPNPPEVEVDLEFGVGEIWGGDQPSQQQQNLETDD